MTFRLKTVPFSSSRGLGFGALLSLGDLLGKNLGEGGRRLGSYRWAYFVPLPGALEELKDLAEEGKVRKFCSYYLETHCSHNSFLFFFS